MVRSSLLVKYESTGITRNPQLRTLSGITVMKCLCNVHKPLFNLFTQITYGKIIFNKIYRENNQAAIKKKTLKQNLNIPQNVSAARFSFQQTQS